MAASATALALAASGSAFAQSCVSPEAGRVECDGAFTAPVFFGAVDDLTLVLGENAPTSVTVVGDNVGAGVIGRDAAVGVVSNADINVDNAYGAFGIYSASDTAASTVDNAGTVAVTAVYGFAEGVFASGSDVEIDNSGSVQASGYNAIGVEGDGGDVGIDNSGSIDAAGYLFATGVLAEGTGDVVVDNSGQISASATAYNGTYGLYGTAYGVQARGDGVSIDNAGDITTVGTFATGVSAYAAGESGISIDNSGLIEVDGTTGYATGISAVSPAVGSQVSVDNSGDIVAAGLNGATGIDVLATGEGATGSVVNSGSVSASTGIGTPYASNYTASGILVSADGDASIDNAAGGSILVTGGGPAYGAMATSFAGNASVTNAGDIGVTTDNKYAPVAYGALAFSSTGTASVDNSGDIMVEGGKYLTQGVSVSSYGDATATNSGSIGVYSQFGKYGASGIQAQSSAGDVLIDNAEGGAIDVDVGFQAGVGFGLAGLATTGDVQVNNAGSIDVQAVDQALGITSVAQQGDVHVDNAGSIVAGSYLGIAAGVFARADQGLAAVANSGEISAVSDYVAYGVVARGTEGDVDNSGSVQVQGDLVGFGIAATTLEDATVVNSGSIEAAANGSALGVFVVSDGGDVVVDNAGTMTATSLYGLGQGIAASGDSVQVDNSGSIQASGYTWALGIEAAAAAGDASVSNSGDIVVESVVQPAIGIYASGTGLVSVDNSGSISATSAYHLADGIFASGADVEVDNSGSIDATGFDWAAGIEAESTGTTTVTSSGDIVATATSTYQGYYGHAYGIYATGADISVDNSGGIAAQGLYATGIHAQANAAGDITVANSGDIVAGDYTIYAAGIRAASSYEGAAISVDNSGSIDVASLYGSTGIEVIAVGEGATGAVTNSGQITAYSSEYYAGTSGIAVTADAGASIINDGQIQVTYGDYAYGAQALTFNGDAVVDNTGSIDTTGGFTAYGVLAASANGAGAVTNTGDITATSIFTTGTSAGIVASGSTAATVDNAGNVSAGGGKYNSGIIASSPAGDVMVDSSGSIAVADSKYSWGVRAVSDAGDVWVHNSGAIDVTGSKYAAGIAAISGSGAVSATNAGDISVVGEALANAYGIKAITSAGGDILVDNAAGGSVAASAYGGAAFGLGALASAGGDVGIGNAGSVTATGSSYASEDGTVYGSVGVTGIFARTNGGDIAVDNSGSVHADNPYASAEAVFAQGVGGDVTIDNSGDILATASGQGGTYAPAYTATGVYAYSDSTVAISNAGDIAAESGYGLAYGVQAISPGQVTVTNAGSITATATDLAIAVDVNASAATINNSGTIDTTAANDGRVAVWGGDGVETINNTGQIHGAVVTNGGDDVFNNGAGGTWFVDNLSTDFGAGDDTVNNAAGGTIHFQDGAIHMGSGAGNAFNNAGTIKVSGFGAIHMGSGEPAATEAAGARTMLAAPPMAAAVPSLNTVPLVNSGVIDMVDGVADDSLLIVGDLGGNGSLNIDVDVPTAMADALFVDGSMVEGAVQTVNATFNPSLLAAAEAGDPVPFAWVSGNSSAGSFVGGEVIGYDASNFLDLGVSVSSQIDTSNATDDVFSIGVDVDGLNNAGSLAASVGSGAWSLLTSTIGTWRQRMGVVPERSPDRHLAPFVRVFHDEGDISQEHTARNFGQGGHFDFTQTNSGTEVGLNFEPTEGFNLGVMFGKARGKQQLLGEGMGSDKIKADVYGVYGTWIGQQGWYLDASYRAMRYDARMDSDSEAGRQVAEGKAGAFNVETGYAFELGSGLRLEPQFQYTWTTVDSVFVQGSETYFRTDDADFHRSRLGLAVWQPFETGAGLTWTPYGAASVVRVDDAKTGYTVGDVFYGNTGIQGTGALVELGVGLRKDGFSGTLGANWSDGGALDSFVGGQLVLRYDW